LEHRKRLVDSFVNSIHLFDDRIVVTFNYKNGAKTIMLADIPDDFGSDLESSLRPSEALMRKELRNQGFTLSRTGD